MMSPPLLLCYQLGQLTSFYHGLLVDILGPAAALSQAVAGCRDVANRCVGPTINLVLLTVESGGCTWVLWGVLLHSTNRGVLSTCCRGFY
jgi:hypothetical protein